VLRPWRLGLSALPMAAVLVSVAQGHQAGGDTPPLFTSSSPALATEIH